MPEPLFATFSASYAFLQNSCCKVTPHFPPVLKAVGDRFRRAVDTNRDSIDLRIDDSLRERLAGKSNKAQLQAIDNRFFGFAIDGHPNVTRIRRENAVPGECRLKAHNTVGYSQAREGDFMFEIRGKISAGIQTAADLDEQSPARGFAQVVGMDTKRIQLARSHDSPFLDNRNEPLHGQSCFCQVEAPKDAAAVTEACAGDFSINLDSRKGRHIKIRPKNWGTVWGTIVPKHELFDPKTGMTGQAKLLISEQQAPGLSKLLNRCRGQNSYRGFESPPLRQISPFFSIAVP
jgi:hypothetical protein